MQHIFRVLCVQLLYNATIEINVNNFDSKKKQRILHLKEIGFLDNDRLCVRVHVRVFLSSDSGQVKLHPSLFLLLLVLSRLYPSPMDGSSSPLGLAPFMPFIIR